MSKGLIKAHTATKGVKVGDLIDDNDPRMAGRQLRIEDFGASGGFVYAICGFARGNATRRVEIRLDRIHVDDKTRRSGFSLVRK